MSTEGFVRVAATGDVAEGMLLSVDVNNDEQICLIRFQGEIYAIANGCSHADFPMSDGELVDDFVVECGLHGAQFDIRDGSVLEPPAHEPITCYEVKVEADGVWVRPGGI